ncbi:chemotaxis protein CheW [Oceanispirochaeta crateris]|uniref:Chemotaxis protein CheW n=1 Tax=Oceanispirochaeta crateris TaxID=2518645 RepID=A0A5C1QJJ9_9SPIO|nr:chemotaxis protein CheW [Oceanispirochaeta crateris]QEN08323.1 chemotaxis protein CheW [Oceanispirochaeta crateris]
MDEHVIIKQYLTFNVGGDDYAINVGNIREVLEFQSVSRVPRMPDYMRGIINLRGSVVPVIDLKTKFDLGQTEKSIDTSVIVTELKIGDDDVVLGLLTDAVNEVVDIDETDIEPTPNIGTTIDSSFIKGMGKKDDKFIIILNINRIFSNSEVRELTTESISEGES